MAESIPRRAVFLTHPVFATPAFGRNHPLSIERHGALMRLLTAQGWLDESRTAVCPVPDKATLARFHDQAYLDAFERAATTMKADQETRTRYNLGTMECPLFEGLWERARASVGGAIKAAELAMEGYVPFHPAGGTHHGQRGRASGFCYLNDPVFAILGFLEQGLERVVYVDLDAHHGDGVEDAFAADPRVMTISVHEAGRWPGTGRLGDRREGRARNLPVPKGFSDAELAFLMREAIEPAAQAFAPDAVVITCGADALAGDPLSGLALSNGALSEAVMRLVSLAPRAAVLGGGGYNPWTLARGWSVIWARLAGLNVEAPATVEAIAVLASLDCDLVDAEDRDPAWTARIYDRPQAGEVRSEVRDLACAC